MPDQPRKIKCFIASAFGYTDVDKYYDMVVLPVLKANHIQPFIINRVVHNENIDQKIIQLINTSDIAIADLTYARPSVYYEAGYAEKAIPVIYTARNDHFKQRADDPNGNLIVHFDLNKKNIISWSLSTIQSAKKNLDRRIKLVAGPIQAAIQTEYKETQRASEFSNANIGNKIERVYETIDNLMLQKGYINSSPKKIAPYISSYYIRKNKSSIIYISCHFVDNMNKTDFKNFDKRLNTIGLFMEQSIESHYKAITRTKKPKKLLWVEVFVSLSKIRNNSLHSVFPMYSLTSNPDHIYAISPLGSPSLEIANSISKNHSYSGVSADIHLCKIDNQPYEDKYRDACNDILNSVEAMCD